MAPPTPVPEPAPQPLDVPTLLAASLPRGGLPVTRLLAVGFLLAVVATLLINSPAGRLFAAALLLGGLVGTFWVSAQVFRAHKAEQSLLQSIEDFITLRHWQHAAAALQDVLSRPMKLEISRTRALIYLSGVLTRYHRYEDAIVVQDHLLEGQTLDPRGEYAVRLGRAMALLHADRLWDADRAISELRRIVSQRRDRAAEASDPETTAQTDPLPASADSAALALIEMYRDVKTGHPDEVLATFQAALPVMRRQLGPRLGDGYALAAAACERLGRASDAERFWRDATLLVPPEELARRYPELEPLRRLPAAPRPALLGPGGPT